MMNELQQLKEQIKAKIERLEGPDLYQSYGFICLLVLNEVLEMIDDLNKEAE